MGSNRSQTLYLAEVRYKLRLYALLGHQVFLSQSNVWLKRLTSPQAVRNFVSAYLIHGFYLGVPVDGLIVSVPVD